MTYRPPTRYSLAAMLFLVAVAAAMMLLVQSSLERRRDERLQRVGEDPSAIYVAGSPKAADGYRRFFAPAALGATLGALVGAVVAVPMAGFRRGFAPGLLAGSLVGGFICFELLHPPSLAATLIACGVIIGAALVLRQLN